jgi:chlorite dismutase
MILLRSLHWTKHSLVRTLNGMKPANHTYFMHLRTTSAWLALPPSQRHEFVDTTIRPLLARNPAVQLRYFDSEAFNADVSDVAMWETTDVLAYQSLIEELRETKFWSHYFEIVRIVPAIEQAFAAHYHVEPI